jgi:hypothetical protein
MGWRDLLQTGDETFVSPWVGGRSLRRGARTWTIDGRVPKEPGWYSFKCGNRTAKLSGQVDNPGDVLGHLVRGYLVGDRIVDDTARVDPDPVKIIDHSEAVNLVEPGLDRFARISAGRMFEDGPLVYERQEMPLGSEEVVLQAFLNKKESVDDIPGVPPALDAAFRMEAYQREEARKRREELERQRLIEERRKYIQEKLGDGKGRRELAAEDFTEAARAALAVGGAQYLDHRKAVGRNEMVVRFQFERRQYECTCDRLTLGIVDAGICLIDHNTGERGDTRFTLESLPGVIRQAKNGGRLVVFRHVDEGHDDDDHDDNDDD